MAAVAVGASTRQEIVRELSPAGTKSATAKYLAGQLSAPIRLVRDELEQMAREGTIKSRRIRSGETLFRLKDRIDSAWEGQRGLSLPFHSHN